MHHVAMTHHHHNSHLTPVGASPQYSVPPQQPPHTPSTPVSRRTSVDSNPGKGKKRKSGPHAGYDHNGMLSEVSQKIWDFFFALFLTLFTARHYVYLLFLRLPKRDRFQIGTSRFTIQ